MNKNREITPQWLFLDLNSYFASVEQQDRPALRGKPVAVVPMATDSTCAIAASYEAKAYGIRTGTKIYEARRMCPGLQCVLARHDLYVDYHHKIRNAVERHLPIHKIWSIDEFDCILLGRECDPAYAIELANTIKRSIHTHVGPAINCSIGIAPNSFLAKIGTEMEKPDGLVILRSEDLPGRLFDLKLTDLPGINIRMEQRLLRARVRSVEDLWNLSPKQARAIWRSVQGERFWYWLHGHDIPYQDTKPSMVGHSRVLDPDLRSPDKTRQMARRLLFKAACRLRRKRYHASALRLGIRIIDGPRIAVEKHFPAAGDPFTFLDHLNDLWDAAITECMAHGISIQSNRKIFKKVSVILYGLQKNGAITDDLFEVVSPETQQQTHRRERLASAIETLQQKYKQETVSLGVPPKTQAGHIGTKIAFSRVPEREEFWT